MRVLQTVYAIARDLVGGDLTMRAMSLVYTTLLSLVPLLALSFSVLKAFGVHNHIRPTLETFLDPLGPKGAEITGQIIGFVENMRVGVLGALGLGLLVYTVISLLQKIEVAFNHVWHVQRPRPLAQRFSQYLSVLTVGPILVFAALGVTATLFSHRVVQTLADLQPLGTIVAIVGRLVPYLLVTGAFTFMYMFMPNTRVRLRPALTGGLIAAVLWQSVGWGFTAFVAGSTKYTAIYAGFAIVVLGMIWLYLNWLIVLIGSNIAFYSQHPDYLSTRKRKPQLSNRTKETLALLAFTWIGRHFQQSAPAWTADALARHLATPPSLLARLLETFVRRGLLVETGDDPPRYLPARALETITVKELLSTVRTAEDEYGFGASSLLRDEEVESLLARADSAVGDALGSRTLHDLASAPVPAEARERAAVFAS